METAADPKPALVVEEAVEEAPAAPVAPVEDQAEEDVLIVPFRHVAEEVPTPVIALGEGGRGGGGEIETLFYI